MAHSAFWHYLTSVKAKDGEQPEGDLRELQFKKNQYGPAAESIVLRYQRGLFLPVGGTSSLDRHSGNRTPRIPSSVS